MNQNSDFFDLRNTVEYRELGFKIVTCPVCGKETLDNHWICRSCGWEYDGITEDDIYSACNRATISVYRRENKAE